MEYCGAAPGRARVRMAFHSSTRPWAVAAHPVHVIQQDEFRDARLGLVQEVGDGAGVDLEAREGSAEGVEILLSGIPGSSRGYRSPGSRLALEVVVAEGQPGDDRLELVADELGDSAGVLVGDLVVLGPGAHQGGQGNASP